MSRSMIGAALVGLLVGNGLEGQRMDIAGTVECGQCSIRIEPVLSIVGVTFDGPASTIARSTRGDVVVLDRALQRVRRFGPDGRLRHDIGRKGGGPGEYEMVRDVLVTPDQHVHLIDNALSRHTEYDANGAVVRSRPVALASAAQQGAALLMGGDLVINVTGDGPGGALTVLRRIPSVDAAVPLLHDLASRGPDQRWNTARLLWARVGGGLLSAHPFAMHLDVYGPTLADVRRFALPRPWAAGGRRSEPPDDGMFDRPYTPRIRGVWEGQDGLVWIHYTVPAESWRPMRPPPPGASLTDAALEQLTSRSNHDSIIEVIDLSRRRVVARSRFTARLGLPFGGGFFALQQEGVDGEPLLQVSRAVLKR